MDFGESTIDRAIEMTQRAGLKYLYHSSPFETWGHFKLKPGLFPRGWDGFRDCVEKARQAGIGVGFHTLSNFITPNDPFVTPLPDPRLARIGTSELTADIDAAETEIPVADPVWFQKKTTMNTVVIGEELVRYDGVSAEAPWRLLKCRRGAWGTKAAAHRKGEAVGKLMDHYVQGVPDRRRALAGSGAQYCRVLQSHRRHTAFARRFGGQLVHRHGAIRAHVVHAGVVRRAFSRSCEGASLTTPAIPVISPGTSPPVTTGANRGMPASARARRSTG